MTTVNHWFCEQWTVSLSEEPHQCPVCRSMHYLWINRFGHTTCTGCAPDAAYLAIQEGDGMKQLDEWLTVDGNDAETCEHGHARPCRECQYEYLVDRAERERKEVDDD